MNSIPSFLHAESYSAATGVLVSQTDSTNSLIESVCFQSHIVLLNFAHCSFRIGQIQSIDSIVLHVIDASNPYSNYHIIYAEHSVSLSRT